jgi:hypothetical protein
VDAEVDGLPGADGLLAEGEVAEVGLRVVEDFLVVAEVLAEVVAVARGND